jgi:hypothetical protein
MTWDAEEDCRALIAGGLADSAGLSRRRRHVPVALDVDGDLALCVFLHWADYGPAQDEHLLRLVDGSWRLLGGGSGGPVDAELADRPPAAELGGVIVSNGGIGSRITRPWWDRRARWATGTVVRVSAEASAVEAGGRTLPVPRHGVVGVVSSGRRRPRILVRDAAGDVLGALPDDPF